MRLLESIARYFFQKGSTDFDANEAFRRNQLRYNALYALDPDVLVRHLAAFNRGDICGMERVLEEFETREDKMRIGAFKMAAAVSSKPWEVRVLKGEEDNPRAELHRQTLTRFWNRIEVTDAFCRNRKGGLRLLVKQMMEAQSRVYSVHDICWKVNGDGTLDARFTHVPAWCFENRTGRLRYIRNDGDTLGEEMRDGEWLVTVGEGVGIAAAIIAMAKRLSWNDWLLFSEKCGMPVVMGNTSAQRGTPAWESMERAIRAVAPKTGILADTGTQLQAVSMGSGSQNTYRELVDVVDRAISALYRGGDLATISSAPSAAGINAQEGESELMDGDGCAMVAETLRDQVEKFVVRFVCGDFEPLAGIVINPPAETADIDRDIKIDMHLAGLGVRLSKGDALARYGRTEAKDEEDALAPTASTAGDSSMSLEQLSSLLYPLRAAGYTIQKQQLEEASRLKLQEVQPEGTPVSPALANEKTQQDTASPAGDSVRLLRAFAEDTAPAAAKLKALLEKADAGEDIAEDAAKLAKELPGMMKGEPAMAAELAEAMAVAFKEGLAEGRTATPLQDGDGGALANETGRVPAGNGNGGQFTGETNPPDGKTKSKPIVGSKNTDSPEVQAKQIEKAKAAFAKCLETHEDVENAFTRGDIGPIDVRWGVGRKGIRHLVERRDEYAKSHPGALDGHQTLEKLAETTVRGTITEVTRKSGHNTVAIEHDGFRTLLTQDYEGGNHWVLSGYEISEEGRGYRKKKAGQG